MRHSTKRIGGRAERGSIAVETALSLPLLLLFLTLPLFLARVFWYYSVAEKAAHDAARYLSGVTPLEIVAPAGSSGAQLPVAALAEAIAHAEMEEIKPALEWWAINAYCDTSECGLAVPETVRVSVKMRMRDGIFGPFTEEVLGDGPLSLETHVTMRYVGD